MRPLKISHKQQRLKSLELFVFSERGAILSNTPRFACDKHTINRPPFLPCPWGVSPSFLNYLFIAECDEAGLFFLDVFSFFL